MKIDRKERVLLGLLKECAGEEKGIIKKSALPRREARSCYNIGSGFTVEHIAAFALDVQAALAAGNADIGTAAGAFEKLEIPALAAALLVCPKRAALSGEPIQIGGIFGFPLPQTPGKSANKA